MSERTAIISSRIALALSVALFVACLFGNGFTCLRENQSQDCGMSGLSAMIMGTMGVFFFVKAPSVLAWLANPILLVTWVGLCCRARPPTIALSAVAFVFASSFMLMKTIPAGDYPNREIIGLGAGYWLWLASIAMAWISALLLPGPALTPRNVFPR